MPVPTRTRALSHPLKYLVQQRVGKAERRATALGAVRIDQRHEAGDRRRGGARAVHRGNGATALNVKVVRQRGNVRKAAALRTGESTETRMKQRKKSEKNNSTRIVIRKRLRH